MTPYSEIQLATAHGKLTRLSFLLEQASGMAQEIERLKKELLPVIAKLECPKRIPKDQAWFWTEAWQAGEREVDEQLARGEYVEFDTVEDLLADLHQAV